MGPTLKIVSTLVRAEGGEEIHTMKIHKYPYFITFIMFIIFFFSSSGAWFFLGE